MDEIEKKYGKFYYDRIDLPYISKKGQEVIKGLMESSPTTILGKKIKDIKTYDGIKFIMEDSSWLLLRPSGTEPIVRIYAESCKRADVPRLLNEGRRLFGK